VLRLGVLKTDFNTGGFSMQDDPKKTIGVNYNVVHIKRHHYDEITMKEFIVGLTNRLSKRDPATLQITKAYEGCTHRKTKAFEPQPEKPLTCNRLFDRLSHFIPENSIVIAETGNSLFCGMRCECDTLNSFQLPRL
jgi:indolepyruvate decarboxylase